MNGNNTLSVINLPPLEKRGVMKIKDEKELFEFLLIISPTGFVRERVMTEKQFFSHYFGSDDAVNSLPHLTLANFLLSQSSQDEIVSGLHMVAINSNRIKVVLENFKWFPFHTIYFDVKYQVDIKQLVRKITKSIGRYIRADNKNTPHFISNPHLTLCKRMSREQYEKSVIEYSEQKFSGEFTANEMVLLKRPFTEPGNYRVAGCFKFGGREVCDKTTQLRLF